MLKKLLSITMALIMSLSAAMIFTSCDDDSSSTDPDVAAYDEWWLSTHNLDGSPRN